MTRKTTSQTIDLFLRHKKVDGNTKIDIALLLELMHDFADQESRIAAREVVLNFIKEQLPLEYSNNQDHKNRTEDWLVAKGLADGTINE